MKNKWKDRLEELERSARKVQAQSCPGCGQLIVGTPQGDDDLAPMVEYAPTPMEEELQKTEAGRALLDRDRAVQRLLRAHYREIIALAMETAVPTNSDETTAV